MDQTWQVWRAHIPDTVNWLERVLQRVETTEALQTHLGIEGVYSSDSTLSAAAGLLTVTVIANERCRQSGSPSPTKAVARPAKLTTTIHQGSCPPRQTSDSYPPRRTPAPPNFRQLSTSGPRRKQALQGGSLRPATTSHNPSQTTYHGQRRFSLRSFQASDKHRGGGPFAALRFAPNNHQSGRGISRRGDNKPFRPCRPTKPGSSQPGASAMLPRLVAQSLGDRDRGAMATSLLPKDALHAMVTTGRHGICFGIGAGRESTLLRLSGNDGLPPPPCSPHVPVASGHGCCRKRRWRVLSRSLSLQPHGRGGLPPPTCSFVEAPLHCATTTMWLPRLRRRLGGRHARALAAAAKACCRGSLRLTSLRLPRVEGLPPPPVESLASRRTTIGKSWQEAITETKKARAQGGNTQK